VDLAAALGPWSWSKRPQFQRTVITSEDDEALHHEDVTEDDPDAGDTPATSRVRESTRTAAENSRSFVQTPST